MPSDKFATVLQPLPPNLNQDAETIANLHKDITYLVDNYCALNREKRDKIQREMEEVLNDPKANEEKKSLAIRQYEMEYRTSGRNREQFLHLVQKDCTKRGYKMKVVEAADCDKVVAFKKGGPEVVMARLLYGDRRFREVQNANGEQSALYEHIESKHHYVIEKNSRFIRRFQWRAVNKDDLKRLSEGKDIRSKVEETHPNDHVATTKEEKNYGELKGASSGKKINTEDKVFFHLQQGSQRFVSITSTRHNIYGNTGENFNNNGYIIIDLSYVPKKMIVDVHTPDAMMKILKMKGPDYDGSFGLGAKSSEQRAARDTMRTREVLIEHSIPLRAIVYASFDSAFNNLQDLDRFKHLVRL